MKIKFELNSLWTWAVIGAVLVGLPIVTNILSGNVSKASTYLLLGFGASVWAIIIFVGFCRRKIVIGHHQTEIQGNVRQLSDRKSSVWT